MEKTWIKRFVAGLLVFVGAHASPLKGQTTSAPVTIPSYIISITTNKTTNILFPYSIKSVDRGSQDILAQKAAGIENVLLVKAARDSFEETNLSVFTADGSLFSFVVNFSKSPADLNYSYVNTKKSETHTTTTEPDVQLAETELTEKQLAGYAQKAMATRSKVHPAGDYNGDVYVKINGIYVKRDKFFFKMLLRNNSNVDYEIDQLRFFIKDRKTAKRTASQDIEIKPVYSFGQPVIIKGESKVACVVVLPKFTIPDKKYFTVEFSEKNGGRFLHIDLGNKSLMKSSVL